MELNILFVFSTLSKTGPVNIIYNVLSFIDMSRFKPLVLTLSPEDERKPSAYKDYQALGLDIHSLELSRADGFLKAKKRVLEFCIEKRIQTIHTVGFRADMIVRGKKFNQFNLVASIFSNVFDDYSLLYGSVRGKIMAYMHMKSLKGKTAVACSDYVKNKLEKYCNADKFLVIRNSVPVEKFTVPTVSQKQIAKGKLGISPENTVFIFVGVLIERKDPLTTIKGLMKSKLFNLGKANLLILGDGPLRTSCVSECSNNNNITFLGNTPETLAYLHAADYYIASSFSEGLPTSVLEAISCGIPPILSKISAHEEILQFYEGIKYVFSTKGYNMLAEIIDSLNFGTRKLESDCWREVAEAEFSSIVMSRKYQFLYK